MKFETDGIVYNLGTIDNKQTGSRDPINEEEIDLGLSSTGRLILGVALLLLLVIILAPLLPYLVRAVIWVISLPFKAIAAIVKAIQKNKKE